MCCGSTLTWIKAFILRSPHFSQLRDGYGPGKQHLVESSGPNDPTLWDPDHVEDAIFDPSKPSKRFDVKPLILPKLT